MIKLYERIKKTAGEIMSDQITVYSAQASFYLIISVFPFVMLLISLVGYFIPIPERTIIASLEAFLPDTVKPAVSDIADEL